MMNGFYPLQLHSRGDMSLYLNILDGIEGTLPISVCEIDFDPASVSVGSFLQGMCGQLAIHFNRTYGLEIGVLADGTDMLHVFNVFETPDGQRYYLDARGITDDQDLFQALYFPEEPVYHFVKDEKALIGTAGIEDWFFPMDHISDAMIDWLLKSFPEHYDFQSIQKGHSLMPSLDVRISAVQKLHSNQEKAYNPNERSRHETQDKQENLPR